MSFKAVLPAAAPTSCNCPVLSREERKMHKLAILTVAILTALLTAVLTIAGCNSAEEQASEEE